MSAWCHDTVAEHMREGGPAPSCQASPSAMHMSTATNPHTMPGMRDAALQQLNAIFIP